MIAEEPTVVTSGTFDSATKSRIASAAGVVVGPIRASTFDSEISFFTPVTALVGSEASSSHDVLDLLSADLGRQQGDRILLRNADSGRRAGG